MINEKTGMEEESKREVKKTEHALQKGKGKRYRKE